MLTNDFQSAQEIGQSELALDNMVARKQADKRTVDLMSNGNQIGTVYLYKVGRGKSERVKADVQKVGNRLS